MRLLEELKRKENTTYKAMKEITQQDYLEFLRTNKEVVIGNVKVKLQEHWDIKRFAPSEEYKPEKTTVWSFPDRGDWATHKGNYRGNWSPFIPRNLILKYTEEGDWVLDQMVGSGTTLVECKLLNRNGIGVDINPDAVMVTRDRLNFEVKSLFHEAKEPIIKTYIGDARNLGEISDESIDLVSFHPPYANIIGYTKSRVEDDLSNIRKIADYVSEMKKVAAESLRVLKPGKYCAVLIGDTRRGRHYISVTTRVMQAFLEVGYILKEDIIKLQWKTKVTRERWAGRTNDFYLIAHEHLFVFRKPEKEEKLSRFKESLKWW